MYLLVNLGQLITRLVIDQSWSIPFTHWPKLINLMHGLINLDQYHPRIDQNWSISCTHRPKLTKNQALRRLRLGEWPDESSPKLYLQTRFLPIYWKWEVENRWFPVSPTNENAYFTDWSFCVNDQRMRDVPGGYKRSRAWNPKGIDMNHVINLIRSYQTFSISGSVRNKQNN